MLQMVRRFTTRLTSHWVVRSRCKWRLAPNAGWCAMAFLAMIASAISIRAQQPLVEEFVFADTMQPVTAGQLDRSIARANSEGAAALLIELNTPGGLVDSMRDMAGAILSFSRPRHHLCRPGRRARRLRRVLPAGGRRRRRHGSGNQCRRGSRRLRIRQARRNHDAEGGERRRSLSALLCHQRNRNVDAALAAVQTSQVLHRGRSARQAPHRPRCQQRHANDRRSSTAAKSRASTAANRSCTWPMRASSASSLPCAKTCSTGWSIPISRCLLLVGGALLIYLEFNTPGTIVPGALGTLMVLLAIFALNLLPIRYTAVALLLAGIAMLVLEAKFGGHGALAIAGIVCLTLGTLTLVAAPIPELAVSPWVAFGVSAAFGGITAFLVPHRGAGAAHEGPPGRRCARRPPRVRHGDAQSRGPCIGRRRNLARHRQRDGSRRHPSQSGRPRTIPAAGRSR